MYVFMSRVPNAKEGRDSIEFGVYGMENIPDEFLDDDERDAKRRKEEANRPSIQINPVAPGIAAFPMMPGIPMLGMPGMVPVPGMGLPYGAPGLPGMPS